jgi:hypothetical protein
MRKIMEHDTERLKMLRAPFEPNQISKLPKPYKSDSPKGTCPECGGYHGLPAMHLDYVGHAALTDRLLDVDPMWSWEPISFDASGLPTLDKDGGMWIRLTVCGVTRLGYGDAQGKTGGNAMKERIGDSLRNAAMRFGAALDLWHKGILHLDMDEPEPPKPQGKPAAKPKEAAGLTEDDMADIGIALRESDDVEALKAIFGPAYKKANKEQQTKLKAYYDTLKTKFEARPQ